MFWNEILRIGTFIVESFMHIWPYLVVTIPLAVAVQMSGASKYIKRAFQAKPLTAIVLATVVGAFSPFCSCGVIPVIASLLISGVPLAPVMSFWIASPSMDPEIFFLSVGMIGWELAVWRLAATLLLSFSAGLITHIVMERGWLGQQILRTRHFTPAQSLFSLLKKGWLKFKNRSDTAPFSDYMIPQSVPISASQVNLMRIARPANYTDVSAGSSMCTSCEPDLPIVSDPLQHLVFESRPAANEDSCSSCPQDTEHSHNSDSFRMRLLKETLGATWMVGKFMALAFLLEGLITLYVPGRWISASLGSGNPLAIITAALLGVPAYTTSLTALPMIGGLLTQGMNPAAALAFLIAGPITTLPAMAAVWPLVARRVFVLYVSFALGGAILIGYIYSIIAVFIQ
ncbi:MAG: permease [Proteobacteria bacterium]|nr:permease [Pseudomonadota bacterium]